MDRPAAALLDDLKQRGMLEDTLVIWAGEFGRTVYCQGTLTRENYGRDHHPRCFTIWLAGGGIKPGITLGQTDDHSYNIEEDPVHVHDLNATVLHCLGIKHTGLTFKYQGRHHRLTDVHGEVVEPLPDTGSWWWVVVGSDVGLSTPEVYRAFDELSDLTVLDEPFLPPDLLMSLAEGSLIALPGQLQNDLQEAALSLRPDLVRTFDDGYEAGAMECLLSGSGPTVLLLCSDADHAREVTAAMHAAGHPRTVAVPAPVSGVHVVSYDGGPVG